MLHSWRRFWKQSSVRVTAVVCGSLVVGVCTLEIAAAAQTPARPASPAKAPSAASRPARTAAAKPEATLVQLMRGVMYPASNVVFAAQDDLGKQTPAPDPSVSPNPLTSAYGGWPAVENAALALYETAALIEIPRLCSNGKPAPVQRADWIKDVQGLRQAGLDSYKAAQKKDQDAMVDAAGKLADACAACHDVYREKKGGVQDRCLP